MSDDKKLPTRADNFSEWYNELVLRSELADDRRGQTAPGGPDPARGGIKAGGVALRLVPQQVKASGIHRIQTGKVRLQRLGGGGQPVQLAAAKDPVNPVQLGQQALICRAVHRDPRSLH